MKRPLFIFLAAAKRHPCVPQDLKHSGIKSLEWVRANRNGIVWPHYFDKPPSGTEVIERITCRIFRGKWPVSGQELGRVLVKVADRIYEGGQHSAKYYDNHIAYKLRKEQDGQNLYTKWPQFELWHVAFPNFKVIPINSAPKLPCRWCGKPVYFKDSWLGEPIHGADGRYWWSTSNKTVRCNGRYCRHMDYLRFKPQSKGGIELTPKQREGLSPDAWDGQRALNYLALVAKEIKRASRANHVVR